MMSIPLESLGALAALALADSLSFGTLLVPVWLLMAPGRIRGSRILLYLGTVTAAYFVLGVALMGGGRLLLDRTDGILNSPPVLIAQLVIGLALLGLSFALDTKAARARAATRDSRSGRGGRWRERAMSNAGVGPLLVLAITAVLVEVASMLPYLAATGIIASEASDRPEALLLLAAYCLVMITPALILSVGRLLLRDLVLSPLQRLDAWLTRNALSTTLWIIGIAGFFLAATALQTLGWLSD